jgi:hypothetical protein
MTYTRLSKVHPELFHYTSEMGLFGILKTQYLRATQWQHLNDLGELMHFCHVLPCFIKPELVRRANEIASRNSEAKQWLTDQGGIDPYFSKEAKFLADAMCKALGLNHENERLFEFYVTSFCTHEDAYAEIRNHGLLSQWRYYGQKGGYALVFDTAELEQLMELEHSEWPTCNLSCGEVGYSSDSQEVLAKRVESIPAFLETFKNCQLNSQEAFGPLLEPLLKCCIHFKHWAFAEEREIRLVAVLNGKRMHQEYEDNGIHINERERHDFQRDGDSHRIPCLHLFEGIEVDRRCRLPIRKIIVGPGPNQEQRETKLKIFLQKFGYDIPVALFVHPHPFLIHRPAVRQYVFTNVGYPETYSHSAQLYFPAANGYSWPVLVIQTNSEPRS